MSGFKKGTKCNVAFTKSEEAVPDQSNDVKVFYHYTLNSGTTTYTTQIPDLDASKKYIFIVHPCSTPTKDPTVISISENGKWSTTQYSKMLGTTWTPKQIGAAYLFIVENATTITFQTGLPKTNSGIHTYYLAVNE